MPGIISYIKRYLTSIKIEAPPPNLFRGCRAFVGFFWEVNIKGTYGIKWRFSFQFAVEIRRIIKRISLIADELTWILYHILVKFCLFTQKIGFFTKIY